MELANYAAGVHSQSGSTNPAEQQSARLHTRLKHISRKLAKHVAREREDHKTSPKSLLTEFTPFTCLCVDSYFRCHAMIPLVYRCTNGATNKIQRAKCESTQNAARTLMSSPLLGGRTPRSKQGTLCGQSFPCHQDYCQQWSNHSTPALPSWSSTIPKRLQIEAEESDMTRIHHRRFQGIPSTRQQHHASTFRIGNTRQSTCSPYGRARAPHQGTTTTKSWHLEGYRSRAPSCGISTEGFTRTPRSQPRN